MAIKLLGAHGELLVVEWLKKKGFSILARNYRSRFGEIDIIAKNKEFLVFVEVKTRTTEYFNTSLVVTKSKQQKIFKTAQMFLCANKIKDMMLRFDVAIVILSKQNDIQYISNAFTPTCLV